MSYLKELLGHKALSKYINSLIQVKAQVISFTINNAVHLGVRKLAGRLICELTFNCEQNQIVFTELFAFSPSHGKVCLN